MKSLEHRRIEQALILVYNSIYVNYHVVIFMWLNKITYLLTYVISLIGFQSFEFE